MNEYATVAALDRLRDSLTQRVIESERLVRDLMDRKERELRGEFLDAIKQSDERTQSRFDKIDATLEEQNRWLMRRRFAWVKPRRDTLVLAVGTLAAMLLAHFLFGVG